MSGFPSTGMVVCASNADHTAVELLRPAPGTFLSQNSIILNQNIRFQDW